MKVRIKKLVEEAVIPSYSKIGDAGMDLTAVSVNVTPEYVEYGTGLAVEIPVGYVGLLFPRSSVSKKDLLLCNSVGVVDSGYRGEVKLRFKRVEMADTYYGQGHLIGKEVGINPIYVKFEYEIGDKVAQLVILPYPSITFEVVEDLEDTERGENGFGSTN